MSRHALATPLAACLLLAQPGVGALAWAGEPADARPAASVRIEGVGRFAPLALVGESIAVRGAVSHAVRAERIAVHLYQNGRIIARRSVAIERLRSGAGSFSTSFPMHRTGAVRVVAYHAPGAGVGRFAAASQTVAVITPALTQGDRGPAVWLLQRALARLHYAIPQSGYFDEASADAVIAYRKMTGLERVPRVQARLWRDLRRGAGAYRVRFPWDGRHIEADLERQVLVEVDAGGRVHAIYPTSSGKPSTPTLIGHFAVYRQEPGVNSEQMYDSSYFISGYAIHGYPEVPTYAASHGCLRLPNLDAPAVFSWIRIGTPVDVYD